MKIHDLLDKMESEENDFLKTQFLAPIISGRSIQVRIAGVVCKLKVKGDVEPGWAILQPTSTESARIIGKPKLKQIKKFLALFPAVNMVLLTKVDDEWMAIRANKGDNRFTIDGPARIKMARDVEAFQQIIARYDGVNFWFQEVDRRRKPAIAAYLRDSLSNQVLPEDIRKPSLTAEEREAYSIIHNAYVKLKRDKAEIDLTNALTSAGAELSSYIERQDSYTVSFNVDGRNYVSVVRKNDLTVEVAGICLEGRDRDFDLHSLVSVIREGQSIDEINYVDVNNDF